MDVHPPKYGIIGFDPWPIDLLGKTDLVAAKKAKSPPVAEVHPVHPQSLQVRWRKQHMGGLMHGEPPNGWFINFIENPIKHG